MRRALWGIIVGTSTLLTFGAGDPGVGSAPASGPASAPRAVDLRGPLDLRAVFRGRDGAPVGLSADGWEPRSLVSADFDEDGVPDLVPGFAAGGRGGVALLRGNPDAIYPFEPAALRRRAKERLDPRTVPPFGAVGSVFDLPVPADMLGAGDFDNDGHADLVVAADGASSLWLLKGDGLGGVADPLERPLPGGARRMVVGEMNRPDGVPDIILAIDHGARSEILIFEDPEGAWKAGPESLTLEGRVTTLALADLNGDFQRDLIAGTSDGVAVVPGRDRRLSLGAVARSTVDPARLERHRLDFTPVLAISGRFGGSAAEGLALLGDDGVLRVAGPGALDSPSMVGPGRVDDLLLAAHIAGGAGDELVRLGAEGAAGWSLAGGRGAVRVAVTPPAAGQRGAVAAARPVAALPLRLGRDAGDSLVVLGAGGESSLSFIQPALASTFTVTNIADSGPGSLRQAILDANGTPGTDTIEFNIVPNALLAIPVLSPLPEITDPVTIDGTTQPGYAGTPLVELDGSALPPSVNGLVIRAGQSVVRGLVIHGFPGSGIVIDGAGHNFIEGNFIGTDPTGTVAPGNQDSGVLIRDSHLNTVGGTAAAARNVISGNMQRGVGILGPSSVEQEYVSQGGAVAICDLCTVSLPVAIADERVIEDVNVSLSLAHTYDSDLVLTLVAPDSTRVVLARNRGGSGDNYTGTLFDDGAATPVAAGIAPFSGAFSPDEPLSVLNGKSMTGTWYLEVADVAAGDSGTLFGWSMTTEGGTIFGNTVEGNLIGTDLTGTVGLGNTKGVVIDQSPQNLVGGTAPGARNVIAGGVEQASGHGVEITGWPALNAQHNVVQGNFIGTDISGSKRLPNMGHGVELSYADDTTIGGTAAGARNLISGNAQSGVHAQVSSYCRIQGNFIGTDVTGTAALSLGGGSGVFLESSCTHDTVGGDVAAARNLVSGNGGGIWIHGFTSEFYNAILGNYVGTDASGTQSVGNHYHGILVGAPLTQIGGSAPGEGNVISGNTDPGYAGLALWPYATSCVVQGNIIGLDRTGTVPLGNDRGLLINAGSYNLYGGTTPAEANVIAGNVSHGIWIFDAMGNTLPEQDFSPDTPKGIPDLTTTTSSLSTSTIQQDLLAGIKVHVTLSHTYDSDLVLTLVAPNGMRVTLANRRGGAGDDYNGTTFDDGAGTSIALGAPPFNGTFQPEEPLAALSGIPTNGTWTLEIADVVGGDFGTLWGWSIEFDYLGTSSSNYQAQVLGNFIGTNAAGMSGLGNGGDGIYGERSDVIQIGLPVAGGRNVISGNAGHGIFISSPFVAANAIQSNLIGVAPDGVTPMGNGGDGIATTGPVGTIGGASPAYGNVIAHNGGAGVNVSGAATLRQTTIRANSIRDNAGLGIDLAPAGVTQNDAGDNDFGANLLQNFPAITSIVPSFMNSVLISGTLQSQPDSKYTIDAYGNPQADPSGYGEGRVWLGSSTLVTDGAGNGTWSILTQNAAVGLVAATATDFAGNTSEFSGLAKTPQEASPGKDMKVAVGAGGAVQVTYTPACGASDHVIYWGTAGPGSIPAGGMTWTSVACGLGTSGSASFFPGDPPVGQVFYFVIVGQDGSVEGSYGQDSNGQERNDASLAAPCDRPRFLGGACF